MTRVEAHYEMTAPVDESLFQAIERLHGVYGIEAVKLNGAMDGLTVLYDASRLKPADVEHCLHGAGLAVRQASA